MKVKDAMSKRILYVKQDGTAAQAMRLMAENNSRRLMIEVNKAEGLYGAVTLRDMIAKVLAPGLDPAKVKVSDIMNTKLIAAKPDDSLQSTAKVMDEKGLAGMPVFDGKTLVGVVTMWDVMIALGVHGK